MDNKPETSHAKTSSDDFDDPTSSSIQVRKPKRVLHCSDGVYEEYSSEDENDKVIEEKAKASLFRRIGLKVLNAVDYAGESIAGFLNLTTPKYSYEIEQYKREQARRAEEEQFEKDNTWKSDNSENSVITIPPEASHKPETA